MIKVIASELGSTSFVVVRVSDITCVRGVVCVLALGLGHRFRWSIGLGVHPAQCGAKFGHRRGGGISLDHRAFLGELVTKFGVAMTNDGQCLLHHLDALCRALEFGVKV